MHACRAPHDGGLHGSTIPVRRPLAILESGDRLRRCRIAELLRLRFQRPPCLLRIGGFGNGLILGIVAGLELRRPIMSFFAMVALLSFPTGSRPLRLRSEEGDQRKSRLFIS